MWPRNARHFVFKRTLQTAYLSPRKECQDIGSLPLKGLPYCAGDEDGRERYQDKSEQKVPTGNGNRHVADSKASKGAVF